ncbi:ATP-binding protein [Paraburkholderia sp. EG287A]|uniref:ATP-binding protein n=1 Tax=Paraburkholderia sp. EG287A TaxID=3237012 RepID=UPI0034D33A8D
MAEAAITHKPVKVIAVGDEMSATADVSGDLMEMLATTYVFILMAAIREAIQNGCDAARRAGLSFAEGVEVLLPTSANLMITIIDRGAGMTKAFMEADDGYLSFGSSTKRADNRAAGRLGVGRWAAYGYIGEATVETTHESDMVARAYWQYRGDDGKPKVRLASERSGTRTGTRVFFPVKETDLEETYRAVAWLKEVMQLTMGDSFSVDQPSLLPTMLPEYSGVPLSLEEFDPGLKGVIVHPMQRQALKYNRQGLQQGSLVVLTNHEDGVGGLPFHVQSPTDHYSVFSYGMVVEIPMSHRVPFMPSREELKYTDEVNYLLRRIDEAAAKAMVAKAAELYSRPDLKSLAALSRLLGAGTKSTAMFPTQAFERNWCGLAARDYKCPQHKDMVAATGGQVWLGSVKLKAPADLRRVMSDRRVRLKHLGSRERGGERSMREVQSFGASLSVPVGDGKWGDIQFNPAEPLTLVVNDVPKFGQKRFRNWADSQGVGIFIYFQGETPADAIEAAKNLNAPYGGVLPVVNVSSLPDVERRIVGTKVLSTFNKGSVVYYDVKERKQAAVDMSLTAGDGVEGKRVWLEKDGGKLSGFKDGSMLAHIQEFSGGLPDVLEVAKVERLYLLNPKQAVALRAALADVDGLDLDELKEAADEGDGDARSTLETAQALALWQPFEEMLREDVLPLPQVTAVLEGKALTQLSRDSSLISLCTALARKPRYELTGTRFDRAMAPFVDVLSGTVHLRDSFTPKHDKLHQGLTLLEKHLEARADDTDERKDMLAKMSGLMERGHVNYRAAMCQLREEFPLLNVISALDAKTDEAIGDFVNAMAAVYR